MEDVIWVGQWVCLYSLRLLLSFRLLLFMLFVICVLYSEYLYSIFACLCPVCIFIFIFFVYISLRVE